MLLYHHQLENFKSYYTHQNKRQKGVNQKEAKLELLKKRAQ